MTTSPNASTATILRLRQSPWKYVVSISGGGSAFLSDFLSVPGGSKSFLEGIVPYSSAATNDFLGFAPENYCSERTARLLASAAFQRAVKLSTPTNQTDSDDATQDANLVGVGATASLVSDRPKKGARRIHCAIQTLFQTFSATLRLQNGSRTRRDEERLAADFIGSTLLFAVERAANPFETASTSTFAPEDVGREFSAPVPLQTDVDLTPNDVATVSWTTVDSVGASLAFGFNPGSRVPVGAIRFRSGKIDRIVAKNGVRIDGNSKLDADDASEPAPTIYPGSFNPPHRGHREIERLAAEKTGVPVAFELSVRNVDKPPLDYLETLRRIAALQTELPDVPVWATNAPRFVEKAELFPGSTVALGTDSLVRLANPKYEQNSIERRDVVLERFAALGTRFLVFSRKINGEIVPTDALDIPPLLRERCRFVAEEEFFDDVSSTELRRETAAKERRR